MKKGFFYGWIIAIACLATLVISGTTYYSFGIFFKPLQDEFGWDRALTASANTVFLLVYAISLYIMGRLADKYGPKLVMAGGALLLGTGFALCSQIHNIWHFYLFLALAGLGQGALWSPPIATVQRWFIKRRGLVLGIITSGVGLGMLIFMPILGYLISVHGWRLTYILLGTGSWFFLILASLVMTASPEKKGLQPYGWQPVTESFDSTVPATEQPQEHVTQQLRTGQVVGTKAFIMLAVLYVSIFISIAMIATHLVRFAIDIRIDQTTAASAFGFIGGVSIVGRLVMGGATERMGWKWPLAVCCFGAAGAVLLLLIVRNLWMLYAFGVFYGFFYGGTIPLVPGLAGYLFGTRSLGQIIGMVSGIATAIGSLGPLIGGLIYDRTGSYVISFVLAAVILGCAGVLAMIIRPPRNPLS